MKSSFQSLGSGFVVLAVVTAIAGATVAQSPPAASDAALPSARVYPPPTNLKVLPKDLTGEQVNQLMEQWQAALGVHCSSCHTEDRENLDSSGRPILKFADDTKAEKNVARLMYAMTDEINVKFIAKIDSSGVPVTCGTCHHGRLGPDPFVAPLTHSSLQSTPPNGPVASQQ